MNKLLSLSIRTQLFAIVFIELYSISCWFETALAYHKYSQICGNCTMLIMTLIGGIEAVMRKSVCRISPHRKVFANSEQRHIEEIIFA